VQRKGRSSRQTGQGKRGGSGASDAPFAFFPVTRKKRLSEREKEKGKGRERDLLRTGKDGPTPTLEKRQVLCDTRDLLNLCQKGTKIVFK